MATKLVPYFNRICMSYLFNTERIRCPRLSYSKRKIHSPTKLRDIVKKNVVGFKIVAALVLFSYVLLLDDFTDEESDTKKNRIIESNRRKIKNRCIRENCNFIADVVDAATDAVVQITVPDQTLLTSSVKGGSGFIIRSDGLIITNAHVVGNKFGKTVNVILRNGRTFLGYVTSIDEVTDLAMVNINSTNLPTLQFGSANTLRAGEWVIAIGSPLFLSHTVTAGVVSSVHRRAAEIGLSKSNINYIQTDTTIAMGNSGGPLLNLDGEVVGINTLTLSPGISFAIPAEYVTKFVEYHANTSKIGEIRYYLGLAYLPLSPATRNQILGIVQLPENLKNGVYVWKVEPNSPAFACGLQSGDVIFEVEGDIVYDIRSIFEKLKTKPTVTIKLYRKGTYYETRITPRKRF